MNFERFFTNITNRRKSSILPIKFLESKNAISLANGMPNAKMFPFKEISVIYKDGTKVKLIGEELSWSLQYGPSQGYLPLLKKMREFQKHWHKPMYNDWDVLFTSGSMEGCSKVFEMTLEIGDSVMIQTPTYDGILNALRPLMPELIEILQDEDGVIPENIMKICKNKQYNNKPLPKILYLNPTGANPTGTILTEYRKREIYKLAETYNFLILEDDPYCFLHFIDKKPITFLELDTKGRVIRLDSFSKILSAGLRLGVVTAHKEFIKKLTTHMETTSIHASSLSQILLLKLLNSWNLQKLQQHFNEIQNFYRERRDITLSLIEKHLTGLVEWNVPKGGMFIWIKVNKIKDVMELTNKCISQGVFLIPGHAFYYDYSKLEQHLRICYSYATPEEIDKISEDGWNEKIENDLCILWDMTTEKDIVHFLMENHFFKIAEFALKSSEEPRFTEIILGIIGNMTCESSVLDLLGEKEELLDIILHLLSSEDTAILMQILRLLRSALWNIQINLKSKWRINLRKSTFLREVVPFILKSSTNEELLIATTNFLRSSAEIDFPSGRTLLDELFESSSFLSGMLESFEEIFPQDETFYSVSTLKYLEDWLELFSILRKGHQIHQEILQEDNLIRIVEILRRILISFTDPWNLYPLDEIKASCVHRCAEMILDFRWKGFLRANSTIDIDTTILNIIVSIHTAMKEEEEDSKETMAELLKYLEGYWIEVSKISSTNEIIKILKTNENTVIDHIINLLKSKIPEEKINDVINKLPYE